MIYKETIFGISLKEIMSSKEDYMEVQATIIQCEVKKKSMRVILKPQTRGKCQEEEESGKDSGGE